MTDYNTRKLILLYKKTKSPRALEVLMKNHRGAIYQTTSKFYLPTVDLNSLGEDVLFKAIQDFNPKEKLKFVTYFIKTLKFRLIDEYRKYKRTQGLEISVNQESDDETYSMYDNLPSEDNVLDQVEHKELSDLLVLCIQKLPRTEQIVMGYIYMGGKQSELSLQLDLTSARVSQIYKSALTKLKALMEIHYEA
jgi:RNA polymerase sigma factor (sigma-70 family)